MKILFIPYDGGKKPRKATQIGGLTQSQHAAREYHRKEKLRKAMAKVSLAQASTSSPDSEDLSNDDLLLGRQVSPRTLLGAGRTDPFEACCEQNVPVYVREMLDHAITYQWSEFRFSDKPAGLDAIKAEIMQSVIESPTAWHTIIFAGATHNAYHYGRRGPGKRNEQLRMLYKSKAISCMLDDVQRHGSNVSDGTLMSMITLSAHDMKQPSLLTAHHIDYYTSMDTGWEHLKAVYAILDQRGGLHSIKLKSVAISIQLYDLLTSWGNFIPPHFSLMAPTAYYIRLRTHQTDTIASHLLRQLTTGFTILPNNAHKLDPLLEIARHASIVSADLDQYLRSWGSKKQRQPKGPDFVLVKFTRWCVLHDVLMLPEYEMDSEDDIEGMVYGVSRLILLAYSLFVLVPVPSKGDQQYLPKKIASKLQSILMLVVDNMNSDGLRLRCPDLFLCAIVWGGMCARRAVECGGCAESSLAFVDLLKSAAVKVEPHAWPLACNIMKSYLWLDADCEEPGQEFWLYACDFVSKPSLWRSVSAPS